MEIKENCLYFVKDEFFDIVRDPFLKQNKENTLRPHYFPFVDEKTGLYWLIPCSSRIEKYKNIIETKKSQNKPHNHIQIIKVSGKEEVFLFQDMFPILPQYIDKPYQNKYGIFEIKDKKLIENINENAHKIINLLERKVKFTSTQADINRIKEIMLSELNEGIEETEDMNETNDFDLHM